MGIDSDTDHPKQCETRQTRFTDLKAFLRHRSEVLFCVKSAGTASDPHSKLCSGRRTQHPSHDDYKTVLS